jgi:hypothetical protein
MQTEANMQKTTAHATVARARPAHLCDLAFIFYLVFDTLKRLGVLVHDGIHMEMDDPYVARMRVHRMWLSELGKRFAVNTEYLDEMVACITSVDALARLEVAQPALSRVVHGSMAAYLEDPIKTFIIKYVSVCVRKGCGPITHPARWSSYHVSWSDRTVSGQCVLELSCPVGRYVNDTEDHRFQYWDRGWLAPLEYHGDDAEPLPGYRRARRNVTAEDQRRMVQVHMDYLMGKITGPVVDDVFEQLHEEEAKQAKRANARAKARFLADNKAALAALCNS